MLLKYALKPKLNIVAMVLFVLLACGSALAAPPNAEAIRGAEVEASAPYDQIRGFVVGDRRTVILPGSGLSAGRMLVVKQVHGEVTGVDAIEVHVVDNLYILGLERDLAVQPGDRAGYRADRPWSIRLDFAGAQSWAHWARPHCCGSKWE